MPRKFGFISSASFADALLDGCRFHHEIKNEL